MTENKTPTPEPKSPIEKALAKLREPFPTSQVLALPRITCRACSNSRTRVCGDHSKTKCQTCNNFITRAHIDLDYVGHAELTNRLLEADPLWSWEPMGFDTQGLPALDQHGGLWIRLTVAGHTRPGYGDAQEKTGPNAIKEAIGDALRNAAMRFGAALDLWAKSDLRTVQSEHPKDENEDTAEQATHNPEQKYQFATQRAHKQATKNLLDTGTRKGMAADQVAQWFMRRHSESLHPSAAHVRDLVAAERELDRIPNTPQQ